MWTCRFVISFSASKYKFFFCKFEILSLETRNLESVCKLEILILETQDFQFREILRFKTQNYELVNSKFRVPKLRISRFETQNFEFAKINVSIF